MFKINTPNRLTLQQQTEDTETSFSKVSYLKTGRRVAVCGLKGPVPNFVQKI
jgi:hypothetical protein